MSIFESLLLVGACIVGILARNNRRALLWLLLGMADYISTTWYYEHTPYWIPHPIASCVVDGAVVLLLAACGRFQWETWLRRCFQVSMLCSVAALLAAGHVGPNDLQYGYALGLELCNWAALIVIGASGLGMAHVEGHSLGHPRNGALHRFGNLLHAERSRKTLLARLSKAPS